MRARAGKLVAVGDLDRGGGQRNAARAGKPVQLFQRLVAEPALGAVVDPLEGEIVRWLGDHPQIGERVADFRPLVEPEAADDAIGEADLDEAVFEFAGLELGAHQDRDPVERRALALQPFDLLADPARFLGAVPHPDHAQLVAAIALGPQGLAEPFAVGRDQARGGGEDVRGGPIVLFEPDHFRAGEVLLEAQDIGDLGAAPGIDRLVVVADHADVLALLREQPQPQVLHLVGVLVFVDQDVLEPLPVLLEHVAVAAHDVEHVQQKVAEIAGVQRLQPVLVERVELPAAAVGVGLVLACVELGRTQPLVLPAIDQPGQLAGGPALFVELVRLDQLLEQAQLVVGIDDRVVRLQPDQFGVPAQHPRRDRMERAEIGHPLDRAADHLADALLHLARGLVGEGDAEDLARPGAAGTDDMRQPRGQRRGLAGARAGQHQHRPFGRQHRLALRRVQSGEERVVLRSIMVWRSVLHP